ncbi:MAG: heavy metal translocating P-type ATPase, partial [Actinomycetota bacterium]
MDQPRPFFVRYPVFASTIVLAIIGGVLALTGLEEAARWVISIFALAIAAKESVGMVRSILKGGWGIDVLAVTAIIATVLVGE